MVGKGLEGVAEQNFVTVWDGGMLTACIINGDCDRIKSIEQGQETRGFLGAGKQDST